MSSERVVIVTGASRGLGREIAFVFAEAGDKVVINFLDNEKEAILLADAASRTNGEAVLSRADIRVPRQVDKLIVETIARWGRIDVLICNAGVSKDGLMLRMSEQDWDTVMATNLHGAFYCIRSVSEIMMKRRQGHIITVSSIVGLQGREGQANYSASKSALIGLTKASAKELGRFNIKVNAVLPGYLATDMGNTISKSVHDNILGQNTLGRMSDSREVAAFIHHLSLMNNVSGQVFNLDSRII